MASLSEGRPYSISTTINANDHGPAITVAAAICLVLTLFLLSVRAWIRWPWNALAGLDDFMTAVATLLGVVQTVVIISAVGAGFGKKARDLSEDQIASAVKLLYASDLLFVVTVWVSRLAVAFLFLRLMDSKDKSGKLFRYLVVLVGVFGLASLLTVAFREDVSTPWLYPLAEGTLHRWTATAVLGIVAEVLLVFASIAIVWNLQMSRKNKINIISGFAMRSTTIILIVVRLVYLRSASESTDSATFAYVLPEFLTLLEMHFSLICTTVPCLRIFLRSFNTGFNVMDLDHVDPMASRLATKGGGESINLSTLRSLDTKLGNHKAVSATTRVTHGSDVVGRASVDSDRSDCRIFVRQTIDVETHYHE